MLSLGRSADLHPLLPQALQLDIFKRLLDCESPQSIQFQEKWPADNDDGDSDDDDDYVIRGTRAAPVYLEIMPDPLMLGARSQDPNYLWFRWFLLHEGLFFLPCFIFGIQGLLKGKSNLRMQYACPILWLYIARIKFQNNDPPRPSGEIPLTCNLHTNPRYSERLSTTISLCCCGLNHHVNMPCGACVWAAASPIHLHRAHAPPECLRSVVVALPPYSWPPRHCGEPCSELTSFLRLFACGAHK